MSIVTITKDNFQEEVLNAKQPVLVDFWAAWCGPCRMLSPVVDEIAAENASVKVCKVNIDEESAIAAEYGVMSIPTLILFRDGQVANKSIGVVPKSEIEEMLK